MAYFNRQVFWNGVIGLSVLVAIYCTVFSLSRGIIDVFPFFYFLPIIIFISFYPQRGVIFSLLLSSIYISLVYYYGFFNPKLIAISTAWFVIIMTVGVVTSSFAQRLRIEEKKYQQIFKNTQAGIFTFDYRTMQIKETNDMFTRMLKYEQNDLTGHNLSIIIQDTTECERFLSEIRKGSPTGEMELSFYSRDGTIRDFLLNATTGSDYIAICSAIDITEKKLAEKLIKKAKDELEFRVQERTEELIKANAILNAEILERKRFEEAIQLANRKLNTLSSITRHDILNQITALVMYLSLAQEIETNPAVQDHLGRIEKITDLIQRQIRFTRDYQNIGIAAPQWQNTRQVIDNAITDLHLGKVALEVDLNDLEIYADLLLEKVFYNLVDNSLRHGEKLTKIRFSYTHDESGLNISCEDDGVGIPHHAKEKIFRREYYRNTGYGLFLVSEILSITGLTIKETGEPGSGARFEIHVPPKLFRFGNQKQVV